MNVEVKDAEIAVTTEPSHYEFVIDADLASVGGGSVVVNY